MKAGVILGLGCCIQSDALCQEGTERPRVLHCTVLCGTQALWYLKNSGVSWLRHVQSNDFENLNFVLRYLHSCERGIKTQVFRPA